VGLTAHDTTLQKRPTWIRVLGIAIALLTTSSAPACIFTPPDDHVGWLLFFGGVVAMLVLAKVSRWATPTSRGALQVDARGIAVGDAFIEAADLPTGIVCDVVDSRGVALRSRGGIATINVDETLLHPLIEALRLQFRARPRFPIFVRQSLGAAVATFASLGGVVGLTSWIGSYWDFGGGLLAFLFTTLAVWRLYAELGKRSLTVGSDGFSVRTPLGTETFIPYAEVAMVVSFDTDVHVTSKDGSLYRVSLGLNAMGQHLERCRARARMVASMIEASRLAFERAAAFGETGRKAAILARGGRNITEWMSALRRLNEGQASFRSATIPDDELWRITEDPTEHEPVRVAAAVALRDRLDEQGRQRLRIVVDSVVAPRLRVALDAAVDRDDASLTRALEELEELEPTDDRPPVARKI